MILDVVGIILIILFFIRGYMKGFHHSRFLCYCQNSGYSLRAEIISISCYMAAGERIYYFRLGAGHQLYRALPGGDNRGSPHR